MLIGLNTDDFDDGTKFISFRSLFDSLLTLIGVDLCSEGSFSMVLCTESIFTVKLPPSSQHCRL